MKKQIKILIVDDAKFSRKVIADILAKADFFDIAQAKNGKEGLEIIEKYQPDIILLDFIMPELSGLEMIKQIDMQKRKVIVVTAVGNDKQKKEALALGVFAYIIKPFKKDEIIKAVRDAIEA